MHPFKKGFVLKCAEYGLDKEAAKALFKKIAGASNTVGKTGLGGGKVVVSIPQQQLSNASNLTASTKPGQAALRQMTQMHNPAGNISANRDMLATALSGT